MLRVLVLCLIFRSWGAVSGSTTLSARAELPARSHPTAPAQRRGVPFAPTPGRDGNCCGLLGPGQAAGGRLNDAERSASAEPSRGACPRRRCSLHTHPWVLSVDPACARVSCCSCRCHTMGVCVSGGPNAAQPLEHPSSLPTVDVQACFGIAERRKQGGSCMLPVSATGIVPDRRHVL